MKNRKYIQNITRTAVLVFYVYFLLIGVFHIHHVYIEYFEAEVYNSKSSFHDYYETGNFCKLAYSSSSLFFQTGEKPVNFFTADDKFSADYNFIFTSLHFRSSTSLRGPPSEIS
jgi:hypothetical protein